MTIHFLHVGKAGGTAVKAGLKDFRESHGLKLHKHDFKLRDVPKGEKALFAVREPVGRFVSGFNSRLRKGQPRLFREWSPREKKAFEKFPTPNALAEALSSRNPLVLSAAKNAMEAIRHVRNPLSEWVTSTHELEEREDDLLFVLSQTDLEGDFETLKRLLGLPDAASLPSGDVVTHRTPEGFDTTLSDLGRRNVEAWYAEDIRLHAACLALRARKLAALAPQLAG